eukprot:5734766-Prymnesium_polylepis.1
MGWRSRFWNSESCSFCFSSSLSRVASRLVANNARERESGFSRKYALAESCAQAWRKAASIQWQPPRMSPVPPRAFWDGCTSQQLDRKLSCPQAVAASGRRHLCDQHHTTGAAEPRARNDICAKNDAGGMNAVFNETVYCVAAEPDETLLRVSVTDVGQEVAYETAVLGRLRRGYRVLRTLHALKPMLSICKSDRHDWCPWS